MITSDCPICSSLEQKELLNINCGKIDNSPLYTHIKIKECKNCSHIFNELSEKDLSGLIKYYNEEYVLTNLSSPDTQGDRPGSQSINSRNRFEQLYLLAKDFLSDKSKVLDIGCAMGGFLEHLKEKGLIHLYGIDFTQKYVEYAKNTKKLNVKFGLADDVPFSNDKFDVLFMDQVLEHMINPRKAFIEARRVLKKDGYFFIGVPNASKYNNNFIFDFFWFLMKEHIQHFDIHHLTLLAESEGFELVNYNMSNTPMMNNETLLPNLNVLFKLTDIKKEQNINNKLKEISKGMQKYIKNEFQRLENKRSLIQKIKNTNQPLYVWGIGREFLYLFFNSELEKCNIVKLIDGNSYKRDSLTIKGKKIYNPENLINSSSNSILLITATAYSSKIKEIALEYGFKGEIIEI